MSEAKRIVGYSLQGMDSRAGEVTFSVETEGGELQRFAAADEVFTGMVRFLEGVEESLLWIRGRGRQANAGAAEPLQGQRDVDIVIDLTGATALLKVRTESGRAVQVELSEELLARLEARLPDVLAELRKRRGGPRH